MDSKAHTVILVTATVMLIGLVVPATVQAKNEVYTDQAGLAIRGYDPVAYHEKGRPLEGSSNFEFVWKGARWRFANATHRDLFKADPERYAPRYGGYCAWAVSQGYTASVDPENAWRIVAGKLYLNYSVAVKKRWETDIPGHIQKANVNWPDVLK